MPTFHTAIFVYQVPLSIHANTDVLAGTVMAPVLGVFKYSVTVLVFALKNNAVALVGILLESELIKV